MQKYVELVDKTKWDILDRFIQNGNLKEYRDLYHILNNASEKLIKLRDCNVENLICGVINDYVEQTRAFVEEGTTPGISAGIATYKGPEIKGPEINVYYGKTSGLENAKPIDQTVRFDSASVTKMYTALQYIIEDYLIDTVSLIHKKISAINPEFKQDTTLRELLSFYHVFHTNGKLEKVCSTEEEAIELLKKAEIVKSRTFLYSDIPYMIAAKLDPNFKSKFENIFVKGMNLTQTGYTVKPEDTITGGAMNALDQVYDPKARILSYAGHAGIYTTTHDSLKLFGAFMNGNPIPSYFVECIIAEPIFINRYVTGTHGTYGVQYEEVSKVIGNEKVTRYNPICVNKAMGVYCKHPLGLEKTDVLPYQSKYAFAVDGFTGCWLNYDLANKMSANIFTNPLSGSEDGKKPKGYIYTLDSLKEKSIETAIALQLAQTVFETYYGKSEDFQKRYIK